MLCRVGEESVAFDVCSPLICWHGRPYAAILGVHGIRPADCRQKNVNGRMDGWKREKEIDRVRTGQDRIGHSVSLTQGICMWRLIGRLFPICVEQRTTIAGQVKRSLGIIVQQQLPQL